MTLGDARTGKLAGNMAAFGRALRRAGVAVDSARIALATEAAMLVGLERKDDLGAALEAVLVSEARDRALFREMFATFFSDPNMAHKLLAQMLPSAQGSAPLSRKRPRVRDALSPARAPLAAVSPAQDEHKLEFDAAMTASQQERLRQADFNLLSATEYALVESLVRRIAMPLPSCLGRRTRAGTHGARLHWPRVLRDAARHDGACAALPRQQRQDEPLPLLLLVDVSGSMERYARLLLAFLHAATRRQRRRDVFAIGTRLTDLTPSFRLSDGDAMLAHAGACIQDFAGGTQLGAALAQLRAQHARRLVGGRTLVLLVSDGLDTGEPAALQQELAWLKRRCARLLWLNPLMRFDAYAPLARGAQALHQHADAMLAVHNVERLEDLARCVAQVMRRASS